MGQILVAPRYHACFEALCRAVRVLRRHTGKAGVRTIMKPSGALVTTPWVAGFVAILGSAFSASSGVALAEFKQTSAADTIVVVRMEDGWTAWSERLGVTSPIRVVTGVDRVAVLDRRAGNVTVLDPEGRELARFGREGQGPGEFRGLHWGQLQGDSLVAVYDRGNGRVSFWTVTGELLRETRVNNQSVWGAFALTAAGQIVMPTAARESHLMELHDGTLLSTLERRAVRQEHPGSLDLLAASDPLVAAFENAAARLILFTPDGRSVTREIDLPRDIRDGIDEALEQFADPAVPPQYAKDLQASGSTVVITLVRPLENGIVALQVDQGGRSVPIRVASDGGHADESYLRGIASITPLAECYLFSTEYGVERYCPM